MLFCFYVSFASVRHCADCGDVCNDNLQSWGMQDFIPPYCAAIRVIQRILCSLFQGIESFSILFTLCMLCDQINSVVTNQTYIDRLKDKNNNSKRRRQGQGWWKDFLHICVKLLAIDLVFKTGFCRQHRSGKDMGIIVWFLYAGERPE